MNKTIKISVLLGTSMLMSLPAFSADCTTATYTTSGTFTCTTPSGVTSIQMIVAGGAGGGGARTSTAQGGQGGSGGFCQGTIATVPGQPITVLIGSGQTPSGGTGGDGGQGSIAGPGIGGATVFAGGGTGGSGASGSTPGTGGLGGIANGDPTCVNGANGAAGSVGSYTAAVAASGSNGFVSLTFPTATATAAESIPTLSEWAMIFMASLMAMFGISRLRRNK